MQHFITTPNAAPFPVIARGDGIYLWDEDGNRYLDGSSGAVVSNIGHNNHRVKAAMAAQAASISFAYARVWENAANIKLADELSRQVGWGFDAAFFVSGGSEAMEASIKLARQAAVARGQTSRWKIISRVPSYHGSTIGLLGVTGDLDFGSKFEPMFVPMPKVRAPLSYRPPSGLTPEEDARICLEEVRERIEREGPETILAMVIEPVGGVSTGASYAPAFYYSGLREICDEYGVFLIFDEVMCGAGRTGKFLAALHWPDCRPDIIAMAKGVSGGYAPIGVVLTSSGMVESLRENGGFSHGHTYAANPQSCAAAYAVLREIDESELVRNAAAQGENLSNQLRALTAKTGIIGDVRGKGLLLAVEIVADQASKEPFRPEVNAALRLRETCMRHGLMLLSRRTSGGRFGEWVMACPPLIVDDRGVSEFVAAFERSVREFEAECRN